MQEWWWGLVPLVALAAGYLVRRAVERRNWSEGLCRKLQALTLYRAMKREGVSMGDLEQIERDAGR